MAAVDKTGYRPDPNEITTYLSVLADGVVKVEEDGTFTILADFHGFRRDPSPQPDAIARRMLAGDPPDQERHTFKAGETGYRLVRTHTRDPKKDSAGNVLVGENGLPIGNGSFGYWLTAEHAAEAAKAKKA